MSDVDSGGESMRKRKYFNYIMLKNIFRIMVMPVILYCLCFTAKAADEYLISYSDSRYLSEQDVQGFSVQELCYAKNEIFARHGRIFQSVELTEYFKAQSWYSGYIAPEEFQSSFLSEVEWTNAEFLRSLEFSRQTDGYQLDQPGYDISAVRTMQRQTQGDILTEDEAETAVTNYFTEQYIEGYITPDAEIPYSYWISYRTTGVKVKYVVNPGSGDVYEYGPYFGVNMPLGDTVTETYLFNAYDYLDNAELYKTGLVPDEKILSMQAGKIEYLGTWFYLDFDGDGNSENVSFLPDGPRTFYNDIDHCSGCTICVDDQFFTQTGDTLHCGIYGVSLDGEYIWLIVADDGPSDDPVCTFYYYENQTLRQVGTIKDWIGHISVTVDGMIYGSTSCRVWDTALINVCWQLGADGMISMIPQEYYQMEHYSKDYSLTLLSPITVYSEKSKQSAPLVLQPQKIEAPYTDAEKWVYLAAEDGTGGWFCTDDMDYTERREIIQGLFMAD